MSTFVVDVIVNASAVDMFLINGVPPLSVDENDDAPLMVLLFPSKVPFWIRRAFVAPMFMASAS